MASSTWHQCLQLLEHELPPQDVEQCLRPLQVFEEGEQLRLFAPNRFIRDRIQNGFFTRIVELAGARGFRVTLEIGSKPVVGLSGRIEPMLKEDSFHPLLDLNPEFTFDSFVEGRSNQLAHAAAIQVAGHVGAGAYNPLLLYGGVGLGKTHLMHAVGHAILERNPQLNVAYMYSQRFMEDMVRAIEKGAMSQFTQYYRAVDVLLMDDIQFLAKGSKSQEEFFHVFNRLQEEGKQIILTCDRYPKEIEGMEERLQSRFVWGMTAPVEAPELEMRVAILIRKAEGEGVNLSQDVAFFIAERIRSNVRELEGALKRVLANARFTGREITLPQAREAIRDLIQIQDRLIGIPNIQKIVADYFKVRVGDLHSKRRTRSVTRPRQIAMALARELTNHSLPEIGDSFGGRDHSTVLHACNRVEELRESHVEIGEDYNNLLRILTS
ncbi:MAG: chromosomal replication initiator protein DnaA [Gammaproteobacteria bacterium]|nr:chromosomal replication initiator protein DnaA [Gammaproteobacteria bacterium]